MTIDTLPKSLALLGLAMFAISGCTPAPPPVPAVDMAAIESSIRAGETVWNKDWSDKDVAKISAHYADDAILMAAGMPAMKGTEAIQGVLKTLVTDPNMKLDFAPARVEISKSGDLATSQGSYTMTMSDAKTKKPVTEKGTYVTVYKKQADGSWKAIEDINTPDGSH